MATPLRWFRRHAKVLMVVLGSAAMAIFGLGPVFDTLSQGGGGGPVSTQKNEKIAEFDGRQLTRREISVLQSRYFQTQNFLQGLMNEARARKGDAYRPLADMIAPLQGGQNSQQTDIDQQLVSRLLMAETAKKEGIVVSDGVVDEYLAMLSGDAGFSNNDLIAINKKANQSSSSLENVRRHLEIELLAQQMRNIRLTGLPMIPNPTESMQLHGMFVEKVSCDVLPVSVEEYISKVTETPSSLELKKIYEEGKTRYPDPTGREAGFKKRERVSIQYLMAEGETFIQNEINKLTDEAVQAEYDRLVKLENDLVMAPITDEVDDSIKIDIPPPATNDDKAEEPKTEEPKTEEPKTEEPKTEEPKAEEPKAEEPKAEEPKAEEPKAEEPKAEEPKAEEPKAEEPKAEEPKAEEPKAEEPKAEEPKAEEPKAEEPKAEEPKAEEPKAEEPIDDVDQQSLNVRRSKSEFVSTSAVQADDEKDSGQSSTDDKAEAPKAETSELEDPKTEDPKTEDPETEDPETPETEADIEKFLDQFKLSNTEKIKKRVRPLKEVVNEVKRSMVREDAFSAMNTAIKNADSDIADYFARRQDWEYQKEGREPEPIDFKALAKEYKLIPVEIESVNEPELMETDFGKIFIRQSGSFVGMVIFDRFEDLKEYDSQVVGDFENLYVFWLVEKNDSQIPKFDEVRDEVEKFWKSQRALDLATQEAEKIANEVNTTGKSLRELYPERTAATGEFSWYSSFGRLMLGQPLEVKNPGETFMETVFSLEKLKAGVAANETQDNVYVVQLLSDRKSVADIGTEYLDKQLFRLKTQTDDVRSLSQQYGFKIDREWLRELNDSMGFKFFGR